MKIPESAPQLPDLMREISEKIQSISGMAPMYRGRYLHWDELRHRTPPQGLTHREWWGGIKLARQSDRKRLPLLDKQHRPFSFCVPDSAQALLHFIDRSAAGNIQLPEDVLNTDTRDRYVMNSLIEEAITSSQLEGAATTVAVAKNMIRENRKPATRHERMIMNNYTAMRFVRELRNEPLQPDLVFELHRILTDGTLADPGGVGTFRSEADRIVVSDFVGTVLHDPPGTAELASRLQHVCAFANDRSEAPFIHPVVRAVILHFCIGYDHPFVDGNGRTARALFYWSMLSQGYWLAEFLSISSLLKKGPSQYIRSYLHTETDGGDVTYFLLHQLDVLKRSIEHLQEYVRMKVRQVRQVEDLIRGNADLNHRQIALLSHALRHPDARYSVHSHRESHNVAYESARSDLMKLSARGLLIQRKAGNKFVFSVPVDLEARLRSI